MDVLQDYAEATFDRIRPCPARADYIELCLETAEGPVRWCFSKPDEPTRTVSGPIVLKLSRYGVQPHTIDDGKLTPALSPADTLPRILDGAAVFVDRKLLARKSA